MHRLTAFVLACPLALAGSSAVGAPTLTHLHEFYGGANDGLYVEGGLVLDGTTLYGTTPAGGSGNNGTVFSIDKDGSNFKLLHSFAGGSGGANPSGTLMLDGSTFYGLTGGGSGGNGVLFSMGMDSSGFSVLHTFMGGSNDGAGSFGRLTLDGSTLYGVSTGGGSDDYGTVYSIGKDGSNFTILHSFSHIGGYLPKEGLVYSNSYLYGVTGNSNDPNSHGTIFKIGRDGNGYQELHSFAGPNQDGSGPVSALAISGEKLYGVTYAGGTNDMGTIFSIGTDGNGYTLLHSLAGGLTEGRYPVGSLTVDGTTLYGTTTEGGTSNNRGTFFSMGTDGTDFSLLYSFPGYWWETSKGARAGMVFDGSTLYGTARDAYAGSVFALTVPEPSTFALLGAGAATLFAWRWRKRAS